MADEIEKVEGELEEAQSTVKQQQRAKKEEHAHVKEELNADVAKMKRLKKLITKLGQERDRGFFYYENSFI